MPDSAQFMPQVKQYSAVPIKFIFQLIMALIGMNGNYPGPPVIPAASTIATEYCMPVTQDYIQAQIWVIPGN